MSLQPSFEYSNEGGEGGNNAGGGPPLAHSAGIAIPRPRSNRRRPSRSSGMRQRDLRRDLAEDEEDEVDAGPWFREEDIPFPMRCVGESPENALFPVLCRPGCQSLPSRVLSPGLYFEFKSVPFCHYISEL